MQKRALKQISLNPQFSIQILDRNDSAAMLPLLAQLNPKKKREELEAHLKSIWAYPTYRAFGLFKGPEILALSGTWTSTRFYSGKQLELDHFVVNADYQSQGLGKSLFKWIEDWARQNKYDTIELNSYTENKASHRFYLREGFDIWGFHFGKEL